MVALLPFVPLIGKYHRRPAIPTPLLAQATQGRKIHMRPRDQNILARELRAAAKTNVQLAAAWPDGVVPVGQSVVRFELQSLKLFRTGFGASGVMSAVQIGRNGQAGCRRGRTDKVKDLLVAIERVASPVFGDFGEEAMLDGIALGSASGVVSDGDVEMKAIGELSLQFRFPGPAATTVAATRVGKNEQLAGMGILGKSFTLPPMGDGVSGESGG